MDEEGGVIHHNLHLNFSFDGDAVCRETTLIGRFDAPSVRVMRCAKNIGRSECQLKNDARKRKRNPGRRLSTGIELRCEIQ